VLDHDQVQAIPEELYVAVVCDVLDSLGYRNQAMHHRLRPLDQDNCSFAGRARTLRWMETDYVVESDPYGPEIEAMDALEPGDVVVHSTDYSESNAPWGELMSTVAQVRGAVGCVCDSQIRDCLRIKEMGLPVFTRGIRPLDSMGRARVMDYDVPVRCGEVLVQAGDLIFADFDGVVVIPSDIEDQVLRQAREKISKENASREELLQGKTLREVWEKYGVL
jgi:4-hydroxy-4-methyl-2-oxoglutarate aldolase